MPEDLDIFGKEPRFRKLYARMQARSDQNAKDIISFIEGKRISTSIHHCLDILLRLKAIEPALQGKKFRDLTKDGLADVFDSIRQRKGRHGKFSVRSLNNYKNTLKSFLKHLGKLDVAEAIRKDRVNELNFLTPEDMLTEKDIEALIRAAGSARDKAIIATLAETGIRPSELFKLQIKDVHLSSQVKMITIYGKGRQRTRPIIGCVPYLADWLNIHPKGDDPQAPLFTKKDGRLPGYWTIAKVIRLAFKRAKIKKPAMLKLFRHSANTYLYSKFPQEIAGKLQGHVPGSQMARHYVHLNTKQVTDEYSSLYGLKPQEEVRPFLMPKACAICGLENLPDKVACERCKNPLTLKSALELTTPNEIIKDAFSEDNELLERLEEKIAERIMRQVESRLSGEKENYGSVPIGLSGKSGIVGI